MPVGDLGILFRQGLLRSAVARTGLYACGCVMGFVLLFVCLTDKYN